MRGDNVPLDSARAKVGQGRLRSEQMLVAYFEWGQDEGRHDVPLVKRSEPWGADGEVITYAMGRSEVEVPTLVSLIFGDALSNYRAALDHVAWELVNRLGPPLRPKQIYFPITQSKDEFRGQIGRKLPGLPAMWLSIVERYQPYQHRSQRERHPLATLEKWVQEDKHRHVHLMSLHTHTLSFDVPEAYDNFEVARQVRNPDTSMKPGDDLIRVFGRRPDPNRDHGVRMLFKGSAVLAHEDGTGLEVALKEIDGIISELIAEFGRVL